MHANTVLSLLLCFSTAIAGIGCTLSPPVSNKVALIYDTYSCKELREEKLQRLERVAILRQPETLKRWRNEAVEEEKYFWGLIQSSLEEKSVKRKLNEAILLQQYYINLIELQSAADDCPRLPNA